jgi:hypothetical protein
MFQFPGFAPAHYEFMCRSVRRLGLPHSEISGSKPIRGSPKLIAAYHVLHRLSVPRHPPNALKSLDHSHYRCPSGVVRARQRTRTGCAPTKRLYKLCFILPAVGRSSSTTRGSRAYVRQNPSFTMSKSIQCTEQSAQGNCLSVEPGKSRRVIMASWQKWMVETDGIEPTT